MNSPKQATVGTPKKAATPFIIGMRDAYFNALYKIFTKDKKAILVSADNGAPTMDQISDLSGQFRNVGIAEEQMIGMACGLALEGRRPWVYAINPFITFRALEFIKLDVCAMDLPIVMLGVGAGFAYDIMGPTHHSVGSLAVMRVWPNLKIYSIADSTTAAALADINYRDRAPQYVLFDRTGLPDLYSGKDVNFNDGLVVAKPGTDGYIVASGIMVHAALKVAHILQEKGQNIGVIDLFRLKPVNEELLLKTIQKAPRVISLEEDYLHGGLGSILAEIFVDRGITTPLLRIGQPDKFAFEMGGREAIWRAHGLDEAKVASKIARWLSAS
ncbi:MAG TPA: transketolase C-terminal domain-containing protein [Candidatus Paceibacterota bacterium]|nr:transketolase C-terminal domain-containing protein [Candidatus Paceibacterota bacterium]